MEKGLSCGIQAQSPSGHPLSCHCPPGIVSGSSSQSWYAKERKMCVNYSYKYPQTSHQNLCFLISFENHWARREAGRNSILAVSRTLDTIGGDVWHMGASFSKIDDMSTANHSVFVPVPNRRAGRSDQSSFCARVCPQTSRLPQREGQGQESEAGVGLSPWNRDLQIRCG